MSQTCEFCSRSATSRAVSGGEGAWVCERHLTDMTANFSGDLQNWRL